MKRIVWIASYPKSGNTWVRLFIAALRARVAGATEPYDLNALSKQVDFCQDNARRLYEPVLDKGWAEATKQDMAMARPIVHRQIAKTATTAAPIVKTHNAQIGVNGIPVITPELTRAAIYIVRHPFDVAVSVKDHFGARDYDHAIEQMVFQNYVQPKDDRFIDAPIGSWNQNVLSWTERPGPKVNIFRYEDMVEQPEAVFTRIAGILGITNKKAITQSIEDVSLDKLQRTEKEHGFVERSSHTQSFFARGRAGAGAELLTDKQKQTLARSVAKPAGLHGYSLND